MNFRKENNYSLLCIDFIKFLLNVKYIDFFENVKDKNFMRFRIVVD